MGRRSHWVKNSQLTLIRTREPAGLLASRLLRPRVVAAPHQTLLTMFRHLPSAPLKASPFPRVCCTLWTWRTEGWYGEGVTSAKQKTGTASLGEGLCGKTHVPLREVRGGSLPVSCVVPGSQENRNIDVPENQVYLGALLS